MFRSRQGSHFFFDTIPPAIAKPLISKAAAGIWEDKVELGGLGPSSGCGKDLSMACLMPIQETLKPCFNGVWYGSPRLRPCPVNALSFALLALFCRFTANFVLARPGGPLSARNLYFIG